MTDKPFNYFDFHDLKDMEILPLQYLVYPYIPEGLVLLSGDPKIGKSGLALNIALAATTDQPALGQSVKQTDVLYFGLEDNDRRMKERIANMLGDKPWPKDRLFGGYDLPRLDQGLILTLNILLNQHPTVGLIVIDILARVKAQQGKRQGVYDFDVQTLQDLSKLAHERRITIIVIHHTNKQKGGDVNSMVSGSHGLTGTADTLIAMSNPTPEGVSPKQARLRVIGRDLPQSFDKLLELDQDVWRWNVVDDWRDEPSEDISGAIVEVMRQHGSPIRAQQIADLLNKTVKAIESKLKRMEKKGMVAHADQRGHWEIPGDVIVPDS